MKNTWYYQTKINGKTWKRTTGESNRRRAEAKVPELKRLAQLHRVSPKNSLGLKPAILREVSRVEADTSVREAKRVAQGLRNFVDWIGDVSLDHISSEDVEAYQRKRLLKVARSTVEKELIYVVRLLRGNGFVVRRPKGKPGKASRNRAFEEEELVSFFDACSEEHKPLFLFLLVTGARPAEVVPSPRSAHVPLLKTELDSKRNIATIRTAKQGRGRFGPERRIPVPEPLMELILQVAESARGPHVFPRMDGLAKPFNAILKRAGIERIDPLGQKLTAHSFRHTYATMMAEAVGNNPFILKKILGHTQISTTEQYCHNAAPAVVIDISPFLKAKP
ncbi:tyrosine-type recombinase/integrase, partial [Candidatus Sumerlaeota bacterium]